MRKPSRRRFRADIGSTFQIAGEQLCRQYATEDEPPDQDNTA
jgi:hypothetical protein